jgi:hypothetical protein
VNRRGGRGRGREGERYTYHMILSHLHFPNNYTSQPPHIFVSMKFIHYKKIEFKKTKENKGGGEGGGRGKRYKISGSLGLMAMLSPPL